MFSTTIKYIEDGEHFFSIVYEYDVDILCITEVYAGDSEFDLFEKLPDSFLDKLTVLAVKQVKEDEKENQMERELSYKEVT